MGVTVWGLIASGLLILVVLVGYRAALRLHSLGLSGTEAQLETPRSNASPPPPIADGPAASSIPDKKESGAAPGPVGLDTIRELFFGAADRHQDAQALEYGKQLFDAGNAGPDEMLIIAQAYYSTKDCANALTWAARAKAAFQSGAREPDESLHRIEIGCLADDASHAPIIKPEQRERALRLLRALKERADADRKALPTLEAEAEASSDGDLEVFLGERYFGYADYQHAIIAIQRGLEKGHVTHLDLAYVYLGRSQAAVNNFAEARKAFAKLKEVPNISPRVLALWELYAETHL